MPTAPEGVSLRPSGDPDGWIGYRRLAREDFQASRPPPGATSRRGHLAAATCAFLAPSPKLKFRAVRAPGEENFTAGVVDLEFAARMDPGCSWWDDQSPRPGPYVLEHEQVHFALVELVARDLNRRASEISTRLTATAPTSAEALRQVEERFAAELAAAARRVLERSQLFDRETSLGYYPDRQREWERRIAGELARTASWSAQPIDAP